jgi:succinate dehydrogenase (ubiquinone) membrane anchor subunit
LSTRPTTLTPLPSHILTQMLRSTLRLSTPAFKAGMTPQLMMRSPIAMRNHKMFGTIPQPPGGIVGTVNDASPVPPANPTKGSYHWTFERILVVGLIPMTVLPFATGSISPVLDATLGATLLIHSQLGFESCITDYIPKRVYGSIHNYAMYLLYGGTVVGLYGLYKLETEDVGLTGTIKKIWNA